MTLYVADSKTRAHVLPSLFDVADRCFESIGWDRGSG